MEANIKCKAKKLKKKQKSNIKPTRNLKFPLCIHEKQHSIKSTNDGAVYFKKDSYSYIWKGIF